MSKETVAWIKEQFNSTNELTQKTLEIDNKLALVFYIKAIVDFEMLQKVVIRPFFEMSSEANFQAYINSLPYQDNFTTKEELLLSLTRGSALIVIQSNLLLLDISKTQTDEIQKSITEPTIHGSQLGMSEHLPTNINLIRERYHQPTLKVEFQTIGVVNQQELAIIYDEAKVDKDVLELLKTKISKVDKQIIQTSSQLLNFINPKKFSLFPMALLTERSDRMIYNIAGGKVIIITDGNPHAIVAPSVFFDFMTSMEDNYHNFWIANFLKILRYIGLFTCILLPGLYVGITSYSPEVFRTEIALSIAGSRVGVPYSSFIEVLFMLIIMELLVEASIRLPKAVSATATTVGGLILGTAASEASLASNIMIIIVSAVAISTFVIPINEMAFAVRIIRLVLILFASIFGLAGLTLAALAIIMYLTHLSSFGEPYLRIFNYKKSKEEG